MGKEVVYVDILKERDIEKYNKRIYFLNIFSEKSACFINAMFNHKLNMCPPKRNCRRRIPILYRDCDSVVGGGLFVKGDTTVVINNFGEVGLWFKNAYKINQYINGVGESEIVKGIKNKLANELKQYWKFSVEHSKDNKNKNYMTFYSITNDNGNKCHNDHIEITKEEYNVLYDVLKNKDINKIKKTYKEDIYKNIIGYPIKDQFIISSIETIQNEIIRVTENYQKMYSDLNENREKERQALEDKFKKIQQDMYDDKNRKMDELKDQLLQLKIMSSNNV